MIHRFFRLSGGKRFAIFAGSCGAYSAAAYLLQHLIQHT